MGIETRETIDVAVTGAAGNIDYALMAEVLSGRVFGEHRIVNLNMLELPGAVQATEGVIMELEDLAYSNAGELNVFDDPAKAFSGANFAFLVGAIGRKPGQNRGDVLEKNAGIFTQQGIALQQATDDVRVLVVGNPANTNALITAAYAPEIPRSRFTAMTRLDHNRAVSALARTIGEVPEAISRLAIWGIHADEMVIDLAHVTVDQESGSKPLAEVFDYDQEWYDTYSQKVATRGGAVLKARNASSAMSAAKAAADHARDWMLGSNGEWHSMGVVSNGEYGVPEGLVSSYPVTSVGGEYHIIEGLELSADTKQRLAASTQALQDEKAELQALGIL